MTSIELAEIVARSKAWRKHKGDINGRGKALRAARDREALLKLVKELLEDDAIECVKGLNDV